MHRQLISYSKRMSYSGKISNVISLYEVSFLFLTGWIKEPPASGSIELNIKDLLPDLYFGLNYSLHLC